MKTMLTFFILCVILCSHIFSQNENVFPVTIKEKFPEITLVTKDYQTVSFPGQSGKRLMLVFPRGKVTPKIWCPICHYQYLELVQMAQNDNFREKYNMEIYFIFPYSPDSLQNWINDIPKSLTTIEKWKNPEDKENMSADTKNWMEYSRKFFPHSFKYSKEDFKLEIPVLFDPDRKVSEGLHLFREEWGGTEVAQNVPTIFIINETGFVEFKYHSQYTNDRPDAQYLLKYINRMLK